MSKVAIKGNPLGTGTFTIEAPNSDTDSTILLPVGGGSVVLTDATQTLTNKTISGSDNTVSNLAASSVSSGTFDAARIPSLDASKITTGTVATARLASGTANSTTYLRGDQTWATVAGGVTSLNGQTGAITNTTLDAIGSVCFGIRSGYRNDASSFTLGSTYSSVYAYRGLNSSAWTAMSGTWRYMGAPSVYAQAFESNMNGGIFMRVS